MRIWLLCGHDSGKCIRLHNKDKSTNGFRNYVATWWPLNPSPPPEQLEGMHKRILEKEAAGESSKEPTNGTSDMPKVKVESNSVAV